VLRPDERLDSLRWLRLGGEPVLAADLDLLRRHTRPGCRLMNAFSSTETGLISQFTAEHTTRIEGPILPIGRPVPGVEISILGDDQEPVPSGTPGRLQVRSRHLAQGYWRRPDLTAARFLEDPSDPGRRLFQSEDRICLLPDGLLEHRGRQDSVVKIRGLRVDLLAVEAALRALPGIREAIVVAQENERGERCLVACVEPRPRDGGAVRAWRQLLECSLPAGATPTRFVCLEELPRTANGKINRAALPPAGLPTVADDRPRRFATTPQQMAVAEIWRELLDVEDVGLDDDFFELGGTSLQSAQVLARLESRLGVSLPLAALAAHGRLEELAEAVASRTATDASGLLVLLRRGREGNPLFLVHPGHGNLAAYAPLVRSMPPSRPMFGLRPPGLEGECWPMNDLGCIAARHVSEVRRVRPAGPYLLAGTCVGGLIAFEMARQLTAAGESVPFVGLIATGLGSGVDGRSCWRKALTDEVRYGVRVLRWAMSRWIRPGASRRHLAAYRRFLVDAQAHARRAYRPGRFDGAITLFVAEDHRRDPLARQLRICEFAREARLVELPGTTTDLLQLPNVVTLAREFAAAVSAADSSLRLPGA
jgi:thioesterase domain-containing protein/acyl carrier protein